MAELTVPRVDFSTLGDLPQVYRDAQIQGARKQTLANLGQGDWSIEQGVKALAGAGDLQGAVSLATIGQRLQSGNGVYGTPIYGTGPNGETVLGAIGKNGQFRQIQTPGFTPTPGIRTIDTGTGTVVLNSRSGAPVGGTVQPGQTGAGQPAGYVPKDVAGEAEQKKYGTETGEKIAGLGQARASYENSISGLNRLQLQANEVMNHPGLSHITGVYGMLPNVPGFPGADAQAKLDTLKSQAGFAVLQAMRDASKTGGALGQVSDFENRQLQNNLAELQNAQTEQQLKAALKKVIDYVDQAKTRITKAFQTDYGNLRKPSPQQSGLAPGGGQSAPQNQAGGPPRINSKAEFDALQSGTPFVAPDGSVRVKP